MLRSACWSGCLRACVAGGAFVPPAGACAPPGDLGGAVLLGDWHRSVSPYCRGLTVQRNNNIKISVIEVGGHGVSESCLIGRFAHFLARRPSEDIHSGVIFAYFRGSQTVI